MGYKWMYENPRFVNAADYYCPKCSTKLETKWVKRVVDSRSAEAKNFNFSLGDTKLTGEVEFEFNVFYCFSCDKEYRVKEISEIEYSKTRVQKEAKREQKKLERKAVIARLFGKTAHNTKK
jgi:hypothetical protein